MVCKLKWINHKILTTTAIYVGTGSVVAGICGYIGSTLPDRLEGRPPKDSAEYWKWRQRHRRFTHWTVPYLFVMLCCLWIRKEIPLDTHLLELCNVIFYISMGALLHIIEDGICGKVPLINYNQRIGLRLFRVGSWKEYALVYTLIVGMLLYRFQDYLWNIINNNLR